MRLQESPADEVGMCPARLDRLGRVLHEEVRLGRLPGAVALVVRRGRCVLRSAVGVRDPASGSSMPINAIFRIYSMTKPVISVAALMLVEEGKLLLGQPVANYLPEFSSQQVLHEDGALPRPVRRPMTVHDLMRHTAGLSYGFLGNSSVHRQYARLRTPSYPGSLAEWTQECARIPLVCDPGAAFEYGHATDVLGRVIEVVSGQPLPLWLRSRIFEPLGMVDTGFGVPDWHHVRIAEPFASCPRSGVPVRLHDVRQPVPMASGGSGLVSTATDYAHFLQCLLQRGEFGGQRLLSSSMVDFLTTDHVHDLPIWSAGSRTLLSDSHGFGLGVAVRTRRGPSLVAGSVGSYFWGGLAGTTFFVDPAEDLQAILMLQAPNQREYYRELFSNLVYAAVVD
ncbi:serine hydrolase domain-containing protein [Candidatus Symbiobacter mobilis]|uniref:Beta-lactamase-like protein n=1 Tax=Candidatus Symbiobacter mobilis CR TaxID=946483 RepID=U5N8N0_9BURK|nr:serine hydrolase domain-containing protein [Candidatus Symbiobacter mobilis]AGX86539.1 beta-lactamase-like protein [Candidatus Symbiobacter mobilis CR]